MNINPRTNEVQYGIVRGVNVIEDQIDPSRPKKNLHP